MPNSTGKNLIAHVDSLCSTLSLSSLHIHGWRKPHFCLRSIIKAVDMPETRQHGFYHVSFAKPMLCSLYHRWENDRQTIISIFFLMPYFYQVGPVFKNADIFFVKLRLWSYAQAQLSRYLVLTREFLGLENIQEVYHQSFPTPLKQGGGCTSLGKIGKSCSKEQTRQDETISRGPSTILQLLQERGNRGGNTFTYSTKTVILKLLLLNT